jgi:hypothetical protein
MADCTSNRPADVRFTLVLKDREALSLRNLLGALPGYFLDKLGASMHDDLHNVWSVLDDEYCAAHPKFEVDFNLHSKIVKQIKRRGE